VQQQVQRIESQTPGEHHQTSRQCDGLGLFFWLCRVWRTVFFAIKYTMNGDHYQTVLKYHLLQLMDIHWCTHFLQYVAPGHASQCIKAFLAQQSFQVIEWPGNSPDLNHIVNCQSHKKNMLNKRASCWSSS
jgi:hypothetical protein